MRIPILAENMLTLGGLLREADMLGRRRFEQTPPVTGSGDRTLGGGGECLPS